MADTTLFLFRNDLRLNDNSALSAALNSGQAVILLYVLDDSSGNNWPIGSASKWWLHHSLISLDADIKKLGGKLIIRKGSTVKILDEIIKKANVDKLYFSRTYEPAQRDTEEAIYSKWHEQIQIKRYGGYLLFEPEQIRTGNDSPYKVFTPFWRACLKQHAPLLSETRLSKKINFSKIKIKSDKLDDWNLLPTKPDWAIGIKENWQPGEAGGKQTLKTFINTAIENYQEDRDRPDRMGTSRLSPYLHFGEISPVRIWHEVKQHISKNNRASESGMAYLRELGWRDFSTHLLYNWPDLPEAPFRKEFKHFTWKKNKKALLAWQKGQTGFPIIDAGMRELWQTGWMHNRVRMIVASFLVKHLLIHWKEGEAWFWDTLVDADLANNAASWQWVAGSGADAAPYFRVFNPILQGKKFDPDGDYVRKWIPELKNVSTKYIHEPWLAPKDMLSQNEAEYPEPIIDHAEGRKRALDAYNNFKKSG
jgi:deoxyribodipyrimidine photo-lyase